MPVPSAGQSTVIITTPDGPKAVVVQNQSLVPGSPAATRVLPLTNNNNSNAGSSSPAVGTNVISSGTTPVLLTAGNKPVQSNVQNPQQQQQQQQNLVTVRAPIPNQPQQQVQQQPQQPQQMQHQQQVVVNPAQMQQQIHMIRTPSGQVMQLTPAQQQNLQRQLAPRPFILNNGQIRLQQSPVRPGQPGVHPQVSLIFIIKYAVCIKCLTLSFISYQGSVTFRPGGPTNCVLVRTEHGLQLINLTPQPGMPTGQQQIRFTAPLANAAPGQPQMTQVRQQIVNIGTQPQIRTGMQPQQQQQQVHQQQQQQQAPPPMSQPLTIQTSQPAAAGQSAAAGGAGGAGGAAQANAQSQMSPNTAKRKCKNFLSTLIRLATDQPEHVAQNVRKLIQGLIVSCNSISV
jgi:hypothetical protein